TPLLSSCRNGNEPVMKYLIEHGANVNQKGECGLTPLISACIQGNERMIKCLISRGAKINVVDYEGHRPLLILCESKNSDDSIKFLIEHDANIHIKDKYGNT
ncbi:hypothetical protein PIROE2DRAFT_25181, partial [Piromyces sp. E2]